MTKLTKTGANRLGYTARCKKKKKEGKNWFYFYFGEFPFFLFLLREGDCGNTKRFKRGKKSKAKRKKLVPIYEKSSKHGTQV